MMRAVLTFCFLLFCHNALAWWATPHMLIAEIAYQNLTPETRNNVDCLLGEDFIESATWADKIRKQGNHQYNQWHYVTLTFKQIDEPMPTKFPHTQHVACAIESEIQLLQNPEAKQQEKAESLKRLIHWVGDIHQPLHATSHIAAEYPKGDRGGNLYKIDMPKSYNNLHAYWDSGLLQWPNLPQPLSAQDRKRLQSMAKNLQAEYPEAESDTLDAHAWAIQSHALGRNTYQGIDYNGEPDEDYIATGREVSRQQVTLAGYRLANLLNRLQ